MNRFLSYIREPVSIVPLAAFRILFGAVMFVSILRFILSGWVYDLYIAPKFLFPYFGFEWVQPRGAIGLYLVFVFLFVFCFCIFVFPFGFPFVFSIIFALFSVCFPFVFPMFSLVYEKIRTCKIFRFHIYLRLIYMRQF